jgi:DNA polymerase-4
MAILGRYSPVVEQVSIDEAYLDAAGCGRLHGPPETMARAIKTEIRNTVALTCSIGCGPAEVSGQDRIGHAKAGRPDHRPPGKRSRLHRRIARGKGSGCRQACPWATQANGHRHAGRRRKIQPSVLVDRLGKFGHRLVDLAHGRDATRVTPHSRTKSISTERTLPADTRDRESLEAASAGTEPGSGPPASRQGFLARTITLKLKDTDFKQTTRSVTLDRPSQSPRKRFTARLRSPAGTAGPGQSRPADRRGGISIDCRYHAPTGLPVFRR